MSKTSRHRDLRAIRNLISQTEDVLTTTRLPLAAKSPQARTEQAIALLQTAITLTDGLISYSAAAERSESRRHQVSVIGHSESVSAM